MRQTTSRAAFVAAMGCALLTHGCSDAQTAAPEPAPAPSAAQLPAAAAPRPPANRLDALPSCYPLAKVRQPARTADRAIFVLLDQTTSFDGSLRQTIQSAARSNLKPATEFAFATFSAFLDSRYTDVVLGGHTDVPLLEAERADTGKGALRALDQCVAKQLDYARRLTDAELSKAFGGASATIARSDVFASLHDFATHVVAPSKAPNRTLLIASDMLENSSLSSFYSNRAVRKLDAAAELEKVKAAGLIPDMTSVRVYVVGAGLLNTAGAKNVAESYRDPQTMLALQNFWSGYFKAAGAELVEFGKPQLLRKVE